MTNLTETQVLDITAGIAAYYVKGKSIYTKRDFIRFRFKPLMSLIPDYVQIFAMLHSALCRLRVEMTIPELKIRSGYTLDKFCHDVMGVLHAKDDNSRIHNFSDVPESYFEYKKLEPKHDYSHENEMCDTPWTDDDMLNAKIEIELLTK